MLQKIQNYYHYPTIWGIVLLVALSSCSTFKQKKLFDSAGEINTDIFEKQLRIAEQGYTINKFDVLAISIFPNGGEQIIDQTGDYPGSGGGNLQLQQQQQQGGGTNIFSGQEIAFNNARPTFYSVDDKGTLNLPKIGERYVEGMTLVTLDSMLTKEYESYVVEPYILSEFINKRVVVMGALGDQVLPLQNGGITLVELLARVSGGGGAGSGLQRNSLANEIRIIRGAPGNRSVMIADLTTMEGLNKLQITIQPNDIIYVPPRRRFDRSALADISAIFTPIFTSISLLTTILALLRL